MMKLLATSPCSERRERGAAIVLVLVTLLLAAFLLAAFIRRTGTELLADARAGEHRQLRAEAYSTLESVLAVLAAQRAEDGALHSLDDRWAETLGDAGYLPGNGREVAVTFEDESGKISLPQVDAITLQTALEAARVSAPDAERMANALLDWMRAGDRKDSPDLDAPDYGSSDPSYQPARRALRSWGELAAVEMDRHVFFDEFGASTEVLRSFMRDFSLHSFRRTNLNSASAGVLVTLGLGESATEALMDYRARPRHENELGYFRLLNEAVAIVGSAAVPTKFGTEIEALRINITARQGGVSFRVTAVVTAPRGVTTPDRTAAGALLNSTAPAPVVRKRMDYPFTVIEIDENIEAPPIPATAT